VLKAYDGSEASPFSFLVALAIALAEWVHLFDAHTSILGRIFTFICSLPLLSTLAGFYGMFVADGA
jgi:hypothetical protein